ncbi:uncharacterized protein LOC116291493 [Actinia tenebrosa]|uniref:Uncharacterized protein LOC116291493 n=1 Tax=Actinia tenebrosa TaxID=6105 RepID=A0A6P8HDM6_ACTTE|nr:uncharacterized protein LOC116291493 [Actinia tenebrosa]
MASTLPDYLFSVLDEAEGLLCNQSVDINSLEMHAVILDRTVGFLRELSESDIDDQQDWVSLSRSFSDVLGDIQNKIFEISRRPTTPVQRQCTVTHTGEPGKPAIQISSEMIENLRGLGFTWKLIADMMGVSRWTLYRRMRECGVNSASNFSPLTDEELDSKVSSYMTRYGGTTGQSYIIGHLRSLGLRVQRSRVRESIARLDPKNSAIRWGVVVSRRRYYVSWPNSLWHLDGHHSLIRWGFVVHGCIDGFSRRVMFLQCNPNNLSQTVLSLFLDAIESSGGLWPSRIRVDKGVENVLVCDAMVEARGENRGSFIAGPSTHNQRIERLWRDVFRCVLHHFYYVFYAMEDSGILNVMNPVHMFTLHFAFLQRINQALLEYMEAFNNHGIRTARNWSPYQLWLNGIMHADNPLTKGKLDEDPVDFQHYGQDPDAPSPFDESENNVQVPPINLDHADDITVKLQQNINPLGSSTEMGIDIYLEALKFVENFISEQIQ